jgi:hypothetical protein
MLQNQLMHASMQAPASAHTHLDCGDDGLRNTSHLFYETAQQLLASHVAVIPCLAPYPTVCCLGTHTTENKRSTLMVRSGVYLYEKTPHGSPMETSIHMEPNNTMQLFITFR